MKYGTGGGLNTLIYLYFYFIIDGNYIKKSKFNDFDDFELLLFLY